MSKVLPLPCEITSNFFYDDNIIITLGNRLDEAKGHVILLHEANDMSLRLAALLEGSSIDFLFGSKGGHWNTNESIKASRVKSYIRELDHPQQIAVTIFYYHLYRAIINYHTLLEGNVFSNCYCCTSRLRKELFDNIHEAYKQLYISIYNIKT